MFTGIVEEIGKVLAVKKGIHSGSMTIAANKVLLDIHLGDSIAVNGVCLTASKISSDSFTADIMAETMGRSNLGSLQIGSLVNLERAMAANGRFGGHIVSGHIDGTGKLLATRQEENAVWLTIGMAKTLSRYIVEKGSIAIDGVSLTVAAVTDTSLQVSIIPHTQQETVLLQKKPGELVNLECDVIGKYVEKLCIAPKGIQKESAITSSFLQENGFI